jgi:hypothetical protein
MKKKNKKPKELMIKSVMEDLQKEMNEASLHQYEGDDRDKDPTALATAVLNPIGGTGISSSHKLRERTATVEIPQGLELSEKQKNAYAKSSSSSSKPVDDDKTAIVNQSPSQPAAAPRQSDHTHVVVGAKAPVTSKPEQKISYGGPSRSSGFEAQFMQAENLKIAQQRIIELEKDIEKLRKENEILASAGELSQSKTEDLLSRINQLERHKNELRETSASELQIFRDGMAVKESEIHRLRSKVEELESRLANDLRKIRVRERELENRLELSKMEKMALLKSKDETILELKRKTEALDIETENYRNKILELNQKIESNQDQFARTVRALRIALTNLEVNENTSSITIAPFKKAE